MKSLFFRCFDAPTVKNDSSSEGHLTEGSGSNATPFISPFQNAACERIPPLIPAPCPPLRLAHSSSAPAMVEMIPRPDVKRTFSPSRPSLFQVPQHYNDLQKIQCIIQTLTGGKPLSEAIEEARQAGIQNRGNGLGTLLHYRLAQISQNHYRPLQRTPAPSRHASVQSLTSRMPATMGGVLLDDISLTNVSRKNSRKMTQRDSISSTNHNIENQESIYSNSTTEGRAQSCESGLVSDDCLGAFVCRDN